MPISFLDFDSRGLPPEERFAAFASGMVNFDIEQASPAPFVGQARAGRIGAMVVASLRTSPVRYRRSEARILADAVDHLYINIHLDGSVRADCGAGAISGGPGSLLVIDTRQPCAMSLGRMRRLSVAVPRARVLPRLGGFDPHGLVATGGLVPILARTVEAVVDSLPALEARHAAAVERTVADLACDTLLDALSSAQDRSARAEALLSRVRAYMEARLAEPLDTAAICAALGVSRSSLYRALEPQGGARRYLSFLRLRRVRAHLQSAGESRSLADLAELVGFADKAHLARAFKREFGLTPGAARAQAAGAAPEAPARDHEAGRRFGAWVSRLD